MQATGMTSDNLQIEGWIRDWIPVRIWISNQFCSQSLSNFAVANQHLEILKDYSCCEIWLYDANELGLKLRRQ